MKLLIALYSLIASVAWSQTFPYKKLKEVKLQPNLTRVSVDRLGGFYTVSDCGIEQFDPEGKLQNKYLPNGCTGTELFEAWPLMRLYAYQKSKQQFILFDHNLEQVDQLQIDPAFAVEPQLAAPASDLKYYWILDLDNSIKRVDPNGKTVSLESEELKKIKAKFTHMREYQSFLFLLDENSGIYIINKLGKVVSKVGTPGIQYFNFTGEDLYYLNGNQLIFYDIFTKDTYNIEVPPGNKFVIATDERLILIKDKIAEIFEFTPRK